MTAPTTFADWVASIAGPEDSVTLVRRPAGRNESARWMVIVTTAEGKVTQRTADTFAALMRATRAKETSRG